MMKAGRYYIGDLCYVFTDAQWDIVCSLTIKDKECLSGEFQFPDNGLHFAMYGTKYGDGTYFDEDERQYCVDSGTIGCVSISDCDPAKLMEATSYKLGQFESFDRNFSTSERNGRITIGHIEIETNPSDNPYMDGDYFDEDDEDFS